MNQCFYTLVLSCKPSEDGQLTGNRVSYQLCQALASKPQWGVTKPTAPNRSALATTLGGWLGLVIARSYEFSTRLARPFGVIYSVC